MLNLLHPVKNSQLSAEGSFIRAFFNYFRLKGLMIVIIDNLRIAGRNACWLNQQTKRNKVIKFYLLPMGTI
jgi:hypothetical protein